jgi:hypothetical protein
MRLAGSHTNDDKLGLLFLQMGHIANKYGRNIYDIVSRLVPSEKMSRLEERAFSELVTHNCH